MGRHVLKVQSTGLDGGREKKRKEARKMTPRKSEVSVVVKQGAREPCSEAM